MTNKLIHKELCEILTSLLIIMYFIMLQWWQAVPRTLIIPLLNVAAAAVIGLAPHRTRHQDHHVMGTLGLATSHRHQDHHVISIVGKVAYHETTANSTIIMYVVFNSWYLLPHLFNTLPVLKLGGIIYHHLYIPCGLAE